MAMLNNQMVMMKNPPNYLMPLPVWRTSSTLPSKKIWFSVWCFPSISAIHPTVSLVINQQLANELGALLSQSHPQPIVSHNIKLYPIKTQIFKDIRFYPLDRNLFDHGFSGYTNPTEATFSRVSSSASLVCHSRLRGW